MKKIKNQYYSESLVVKQLKQASAPQKDFEIITAVKNGDKYEIKKEKVQKRKYDLKRIISDSIPKDIPLTGDRGIKLIDVRNGKNTMEEFVAQLDKKELEAITRGAYVMGSPLGAPGNALPVCFPRFVQRVCLR